MAVLNKKYKGYLIEVYATYLIDEKKYKSKYSIKHIQNEKHNEYELDTQYETEDEAKKAGLRSAIGRIKKQNK